VDKLVDKEKLLPDSWKEKKGLLVFYGTHEGAQSDA
jgi:hypothetical protein